MIVSAVLAAALLALPTPPAPPPPVADDPCARAPIHCHEFGRADVDGDGWPDRIGYRLIGFNPDSPFGRVTVRVVVTAANGGRYAYDDTHFAHAEGPYGAAPIDGVPGAEIALSWLWGAHTSRITVLTFRDGQLVREKGWVRDGAATYGIGVEWIPGFTPEQPIMRRCAYEDVPVGKRPGTRTTTIDFTWSGDTWARGEPTVRTYAMSQAIPWQCSRFGIPGMSRIPMDIYR